MKTTILIVLALAGCTYGCGNRVLKLADTVEKAAADAAAIAGQPCGAALINAADICRANPPKLP
jgi:hypothetical protein